MKVAVCHQGEFSHIHSLTDMLAVVLNTLVSYFNILLLRHHLFTLSPVCVCMLVSTRLALLCGKQNFGKVHDWRFLLCWNVFSLMLSA